MLHRAGVAGRWWFIRQSPFHPYRPSLFVASLPHGYHFDPSYGYTLDTLLQVGCPDEPWDFSEFWQHR